MSDDVQRALGVVEGKLDSLIATVRSTNEQASESRKALYERVAALEADLRGVATGHEQIKTHLNALDNRIDDDVLPTIAEVSRWKVAGVTALAIAGFGGAAVASFLYWAWDVIVARLKG